MQRIGLPEAGLQRRQEDEPRQDPQSCRPVTMMLGARPKRISDSGAIPSSYKKMLNTGIEVNKDE